MFERIREINGRRYLYHEERWREGSKVRSRSTYVCALDAPVRRKKKPVPSYTDEMQERQRKEDERLDRVVDRAVKAEEKNQQRRQATRINEAKEFLDNLQVEREQKEVPPSKDSGTDESGGLGKGDDVPETE